MTDWFAGDVAERYDKSTAGMPVEPVVDFLLPFAGGGALELAIGTGRIAVPLAERGVRVAGIDLSPDMVAQLRQKTDEIPVEIGDMSATRVEGTFSLVYVVFNSINNVTTQDGQVDVFANAAAHLEPGGCFVVEVGVHNRQRLEVFDLSDTHVGVDELDFDTQRLVSHHFSARRRAVAAHLGSVPVSLAGRARPDGAAGRHEAARALGRLGPLALHSREHEARSVWEKG